MGRRIGRRTTSCALIMAMVTALSGCDQSLEYSGPRFGFLSSYDKAAPRTPVLLDNLAWWQALHDPVFDRLVALALAGNLNLTLARERVSEARATLRAVPGAAMVDGSASVRVQGADLNASDLQATGQLGLSWMLDPWGARRGELRAAGAEVEAADAEVDAAQLLVLLNLGNAYADLRYRQRLLVLAHQDLARSERTLQLIRDQLAAQAATRLDVTRAEARVASVRSQLPGLTAAAAGRINEIAVLTGHAPGTLPGDLAGRLSASGSQPRAELAPDVGIPADLIRNRPDIRIAERRYYAAVARIGVARAALYPTLSLAGLISVNAIGTSNRSSYYFGPSVQFPVLPPDSARAQVALRHSQARQAHETWKSTVLDAILEVENALLDYRATGAALGAADRAARLYRETAQLTKDLVEEGEGTFTELIESQQDVAEAERSLAGLVFQKAQSFVALNVRLGAGHRAGHPPLPGGTPVAAARGAAKAPG